MMVNWNPKCKTQNDKKSDNWNPKCKTQNGKKIDNWNPKLKIGIQNAKWQTVRKLTIGTQN